MSQRIRGAQRRTRASGGTIRERVERNLAQVKALKQSTCKHPSSTKRDGRRICLDCEVQLS